MKVNYLKGLKKDLNNISKCLHGFIWNENILQTNMGHMGPTFVEEKG